MFFSNCPSIKKSLDVEDLEDNAAELLEMAHVYELHGLLDMCERALLDSVKRRTFGSVDDLLAIFLLAARHCNASYIRLLEAAEAELAFNLFEARICSCRTDIEHKL